MSVSQPLLAKNRQGTRQQRHITVFSAFAEMHLHDHALRVDVTDLQTQALLKPQAQRVDCPEEVPKMRLTHTFDERSYLVDRQHVGESLGSGNADFLERLPIARHGVVVEKLDAGRGNLDCARGELFLIPEVEQVLSDLALGESRLLLSQLDVLTALDAKFGHLPMLPLDNSWTGGCRVISPSLR
jgi:hypothetical protein